MTKNIMLINRSQIVEWFSYLDYYEAMKEAFISYSVGRSIKPSLMHSDLPEGEFHIKCGGIIKDKVYYGIKSNGGFFQNQSKYLLPNIIGLITLIDGENGFPLAIMDSTEITSRRTAVTSALAARYLANPDSRTLLICGTGNQARHQLRAMLEIVPKIDTIYVWGETYSSTVQFMNEMSLESHAEIIILKDLSALKNMEVSIDIIITCTSSKSFFLSGDVVKKGTFISAVGADSPEKQEIDPALVGRCRLFVDVLEQCKKVGELHHALEAGMIKSVEDVVPLGDVISGKVEYIYDENAITIFDTTGFAVQDVAAALMVYEKAIDNGNCSYFDPYC